MSDLIVIKPEFKSDIKAEIKGIAKIEDNILEVKEYATSLNEYYKTVVFTEDTLEEAKKEKANVNKFKAKVAEFRKNIVSEYNKPIKLFEDTAKETEKILVDTYNTINEQSNKYDDIKKQEKEKEVKDYFDEYLQSKNIDFVTYEKANINVTLSASMKSLKEQAKSFVDKIADDLQLINMQEHKEEILVEYKQSLNVSNAITAVTNRFKAVAEEKARQEQIKQEASKVAIIKSEDDPCVPRKQEEINVFDKILEETKSYMYEITATENQIELVKQFMNNNNIKYERGF